MSGHTIEESGTLSTGQVREISEIVGRFREALSAGDAPRIEDYLDEVPVDERRALLRELLPSEFRFLDRIDAWRDLSEYRARFPGHLDLVEAAWDRAGVPGRGWSEPTIDIPERPDATTAAPGSVTQLSPWQEGEDSEPLWIGAYLVEGFLGEGGYGRVYRAFDGELERRVAIKVPNPQRIKTASDAEAYLAEARIVAGLDHHGIAPVYVTGRTDLGVCFIVSKYIEGGDLSKKIRLDRPSFRDAASLMAAVADAAHHAHLHGLVHRDIKPRNILLDPSGKPYLADFGAALREVDFGKGPCFAGTPYYMSPEQARGEGHLVDPKSDIFSLGVVLYELLTGVRPFKGASTRETIALIKEAEPRSPRHVDQAIPVELERICLKAMSKRVADRYATAEDFAADLRHHLAGPSGSTGGASDPAGLVPRGLRAFEAEDAESFLGLLPGPRDRDGLPAVLGFWIGRIAGLDRDEPLRVGLVYGPSGSGKSSLIKAGLLPRLPRRVVVVPIEATPDTTESRLCSAIRRRCPEPGLPAEADPAALLAAIRNGAGLPEGQQLLIVLDQFEQRLHASDDADLSGLADALRQCDGRRVRCLLIIRDDFLSSVNRFMRILEIPLLEGKTYSAIELFDPKHARSVLEEFGRAYRTLPARPAPLSADQSAFLDGAIAGLARFGQIIPVHLSLFAEMVKGRAWVPATLRAMGGAEGVGVTFLEETFGEGTATPARRRHQEAARAVLGALLPGAGADIKGSTRVRTELVSASGYAQRPADFDQLERILDHDLRLITPVDHAGGAGESAEPSYQLTHDYLVPSLRDWLTRKLRETRRGRARHRLAERASLWNARHERRQLPSFPEWLGIHAFTRKGEWDGREAAMMRAANRHYATRMAYAAAVLATAIGAQMWASREWSARSLVNGLRSAEPAGIPGIVDRMAPYRSWVEPRLRAMLDHPRASRRELLRARLALLPRDRAQAAPLALQMLDSEPDEVGVIVRCLKPDAPGVIDTAWVVATDVDSRRGQRLRAACLLAAYAADDPRWKLVAPEIAEAVTGEDLFSLVTWAELLRPAREFLIPWLRATLLQWKDDPRADVAATLLAEYATDRPEMLRELIEVGEARPVGVLVAKLKAQGGPASGPLLAMLEEDLAAVEPGGLDRPGRSEPRKSEPELDLRASRRANASMALLGLGRDDSPWARLKAGADNRSRTYQLLRMARFGVSPEDLIRRFVIEGDPSVRQAILLAICQYPDVAIPEARKEAFARELVARYAAEPDPGIHSAIEWLLCCWKRSDRLSPIVEELAGGGFPPCDRRWMVGADGSTLAVLRGPTEFLRGWTDEAAYASPETAPTMRIERNYAIGIKEVSVRQFLAFFPDHKYGREMAPGDDCPINRITYFDAARYCRRLSELEKIPEDQMCYPPADEIRPGMRMVPDFLKRTGYRLATDAEWEAAARAGTITMRFYGYDRTMPMLNAHAWNRNNSDDKLHPVGTVIPNPLGLFDVLGNAYERCHDLFRNHPVPAGGVALDRAPPDETIEASPHRVIRGGACHRVDDAAQSLYRHSAVADDANDRVGFRIARTIP